MRSKSFLLAALILAGTVAGCTSIGPQPTPVAPTKTPKPTFTPTPDWTPTPVAFATEAPVMAEPTAEASAPGQPEATADPAASEAPTDEAPTAEPPAAGANEVVRFTANQTVNVRGGPGTNYPVIGRLSAGQAFPVTGKNPRWGLVSVRLGRQAGLGDRQPGGHQRRSCRRARGAEHPAAAARPTSAPRRSPAAAAPTAARSHSRNRSPNRSQRPSMTGCSKSGQFAALPNAG